MTEVTSVELEDLSLPFSEVTVDVSILVPAHNEEGSIEACLRRVAQVLSARGLRFEILVIDDGSTDSTYSCALEVARSDRGLMRIIRNGTKRGKGAALLGGAKEAKGQILVVLDADLEYAPEEILRMIEPIANGKSDIVFGSRFMGQTDGMSFSHRLGNVILTRATNLLHDGQLTDVMTGYKAFSRHALDELGVGQNGFGFEVEVAARALNKGFRIVEVPISYRRRSVGKSKIRWSDGVRCFIHLIELARDKPVA